MLGEQHEKKHDAHRPRSGHQDRIPAPVKPPSEVAQRHHHNADNDKDKGCGQRRERTIRLVHFRLRCQQRVRLLDERLSVVGSPGEVTSQIIRKELLLTLRRLTVGIHAQQQVFAELRPFVVVVPFVYHRAERRRTVGSRIDNLSVQMVDEHITRPRRAVVEKEIIAVDDVFRLHVLLQGTADSLLVFCRQVQHLLHDASSLVTILCEKPVHRLDSHAVVGQSEDETGNEIRLIL